MSAPLDEQRSVLSLNALRPGMVLAGGVHSRGRTILREGTVLTRRHIRLLAEEGVRFAPIRQEGDRPRTRPHGPVSPVLTEARAIEAREHARKAVESYFERLRADRAVALDDIRTAVAKVIDSACAERNVLDALENVRTKPDYVFDHSVGVCVLSVMLAMDLEFAHSELRTIATGALLHDVGKVFIPDEIWSLPRSLTDEEFAIVKRHPKLGFEALRRHRDLDIRAAHIAYQHHERVDGNGYPRRLAGDDIHRFAKLVSVADVFDAVTSPRPYREALSIERATAILISERGKAFDPLYIDMFLRRLNRSRPR